MKKATYIEMDHNELEDLFKAQFGYIYEVVAYEEWGNYEKHSFSIEKEEQDAETKKLIHDYKLTGKIGNWHTRDLLVDLCNRGIIEPGEYLIDIYW